MKKLPNVFVKHMLMAIEQVEKYLLGIDEKTFKDDQKTIDAVIRQLEIIGEAARNIPVEYVKASPVAWNKITGLRNRLIHNYFGVDVDIVWKTATQGIKPLKEFLVAYPLFYERSSS